MITTKELMLWLLQVQKIYEIYTTEVTDYDKKINNFKLTREQCVKKTMPEKAEGYDLIIALSFAFFGWNEIEEIAKDAGIKVQAPEHS